MIPTICFLASSQLSVLCFLSQCWEKKKKGVLKANRYPSHQLPRRFVFSDIEEKTRKGMEATKKMSKDQKINGLKECDLFIRV